MARNISPGGPGSLAIARHPVYSALLPIPILCFVGALITDIVYSRAPDMMWLDFSTWLLLAGLIGGGFAGVVLAVDLIRAGAGRTRMIAHLIVLLAAWVVEVFNSFIHARDGWTAVVPTGMILSIIAVVLALFAGWLWQSTNLRAVGPVR